MYRLMYSVPEAPVHSFKTCTEHDKKTLTMKDTTLDLCRVHHRIVAGLRSVIGIQTDITICLATRKLAGEEERCF